MGWEEGEEGTSPGMIFLTSVFAPMAQSEPRGGQLGSSLEHLKCGSTAVTASGKASGKGNCAILLSVPSPSSTRRRHSWICG